MVLEKYPDNNKTPSLLYKGRACKRPGHKTQGADEFKELIPQFPKTDQAGRPARAQIAGPPLRPAGHRLEGACQVE